MFNSLVPQPQPIFWTFIGGIGWNDELSSAIIAAPVGVTNSVSISIWRATTLLAAKISDVAGTGTEIVPWAHSIKPCPSLTILLYILSGAILVIKIAVPMISTIESIAPTSWKWTLANSSLWTLLSANATLKKILFANALALSLIPLSSIILLTSNKLRWTWWWCSWWWCSWWWCSWSWWCGCSSKWTST